MKIINSKQVLWAVLVLAIPSTMQTASLDEVKEASSKSDSLPRIGFTNQLGSVIEITREEAATSDLIRSALTGGSQEQILLNLDYCSGYSLDEIKQLLGLLARKNIKAIQAYLAKKDDRSLYQLYRLSDYLGLDLSLNDTIIRILTKKIIAQPEPTAPAETKKSSFASFFCCYGKKDKKLSSKIHPSSSIEETEQGYDQIDVRFIKQLHTQCALRPLALSQIFYGHTDEVNSVTYSPDEKHIASGSSDTTIRIWDASTGRLVHTLTGHRGPVNSVAYSPDGKTIVSGSRDKDVRIWDAQKGELLHTLKGHTDSVASVAYSPDGKRVASGSDDDTIRIGDALTGAHIDTLKGHTNSATSVTYSPDGAYIASGLWDKTIGIWDTATGDHLLPSLRGHTGWVRSVAYSHDGSRITSGSFDHTVRIWDAQSKATQHTLLGHTEAVESVTFSPDDKQIASGSWDNTIRLWDVGTGSLLHTLHGHTGPVSSVAYNNDGRTIVSGSYDKTVRIWGESFEMLDSRIKKWSREKLCKELSFKAFKEQRREEAKKYKNIQAPIEHDSMIEAAAKVERREALMPEDRVSLKNLQALLKQTIESRKKADADSSSKESGLADLQEIVTSERILYPSEVGYLQQLDQQITEALNQASSEPAVSSESASADGGERRE